MPEKVTSHGRGACHLRVTGFSDWSISARSLVWLLVTATWVVSRPVNRTGILLYRTNFTVGKFVNLHDPQQFKPILLQVFHPV